MRIKNVSVDYYHATHYIGAKIDVKAECDSIFLQNEYMKERYELIQSAVHTKYYYAAVRIVKDYDEYGKLVPIPVNKQPIIGVIILTAQKIYRYENFKYETYTEFDNPPSYYCPMGILNLLSETDDEEANKWREKCRERRQEIYHALRDFPIGTKISFITKENGDEYLQGETFTLQKMKSENKKAFWVQLPEKQIVWGSKTINKASGREYSVVK